MITATTTNTAGYTLWGAKPTGATLTYDTSVIGDAPSLQLDDLTVKDGEEPARPPKDPLGCGCRVWNAGAREAWQGSYLLALVVVFALRRRRLQCGHTRTR